MKAYPGAYQRCSVYKPSWHIGHVNRSVLLIDCLYSRGFFLLPFLTLNHIRVRSTLFPSKECCSSFASQGLHESSKMTLLRSIESTSCDKPQQLSDVFKTSPMADESDSPGKPLPNLQSPSHHGARCRVDLGGSTPSSARLHPTLAPFRA